MFPIPPVEREDQMADSQMPEQQEETLSSSRFDFTTSFKEGFDKVKQTLNENKKNWKDIYQLVFELRDQVRKETNDKVCITLTADNRWLVAYDGHRDNAEWHKIAGFEFTPTTGYPCTVNASIGNTTCAGTTSLEKTIMRLISSPEVAKFLYDIYVDAEDIQPLLSDQFIEDFNKKFDDEKAEQTA